MQQKETTGNESPSDVKKILNQMKDAATESQFYGLMNDAIKTHQKGWETLAEMEGKIKSLKKL